MTHLKLIHFIFLTLLLIGCGSNTTQTQTVEKASDKPAKHVYHEQVEQAAARAFLAKKPLLIVFGASWCHPCDLLHKRLESEKFKSLLEKKFIVLYLDIEGENSEWINEHFEIQSIPKIEVIDTRKKKSIATHTGYDRDEKKLLKFLTDADEQFHKTTK